MVPGLAKYRSGHGDAPAWAALSDDELCPCCGASSACTRRDGGDFARCYTVVSALPMLGGGWLHSLVDGAVASAPMEGVLQ